MNNNNNGREDRGKTSKIIEDIGKTTYKELKVSVMDREEWGGPSKSLNQS